MRNFDRFTDDHTNDCSYIRRTDLQQLYALVTSSKRHVLFSNTSRNNIKSNICHLILHARMHLYATVYIISMQCSTYANPLKLYGFLHSFLFSRTKRIQVIQLFFSVPTHPLLGVLEPGGFSCAAHHAPRTAHRAQPLSLGDLYIHRTYTPILYIGFLPQQPTQVPSFNPV